MLFMYWSLGLDLLKLLKVFIIIVYIVCFFVCLMVFNATNTVYNVFILMTAIVCVVVSLTENQWCLFIF